MWAVRPAGARRSSTADASWGQNAARSSTRGAAAGRVHFYTCIAVLTLLLVLLFATSYVVYLEVGSVISDQIVGAVTCSGRRWDGTENGWRMLCWAVGVTVLVTGIFFFLPSSSTVSEEAGHLLGDYSQLLVTLTGFFCPPLGLPSPPPAVQPTRALTERNGNTVGAE